MSTSANFGIKFRHGRVRASKSKGGKVSVKERTMGGVEPMMEMKKLMLKRLQKI